MCCYNCGHSLWLNYLYAPIHFLTMPDLYTSLMERLEGRQYSNYFACFCVFEDHKSPALLVHDDGYFVCLSCDKKGTHAYLDKVIGSYFIPTHHPDTVSRVLPRWRKWEEKYGSLDGIADAAHRSLVAQPTFQTYFKRRKIYEFVDEGRLGFMDGWATFPVYSRNGQVVDIVVRSVSNKGDVRYVVSPSESTGHHSLYVPSWKRVNESETIFVVFGLIDSVSLYLAGLPSISGITGKSLSADLLKPLGKRFIIVPDENEEKEAHRLANSLGWRCSVRELKYEDGCKDPDDMRRKFGNEYLLQALGA
jgi:hypothetical protein